MLYVIGESKRGPVKLGYGDNPEKRARELQIGNPRALYLFHTVVCSEACDIEAWLHRKFRDRHIRGEWYNISVTQALSAINEALILLVEGTLSRFNRTPNLRETNGVVERLCSMCQTWQPHANVYPSRIKKHGTQARCKPCARSYQQAYKKRPVARECHNAAERARKQRLREQSKQ